MAMVPTDSCSFVRSRPSKSLSPLARGFTPLNLVSSFPLPCCDKVAGQEVAQRRKGLFKLTVSG